MLWFSIGVGGAVGSMLRHLVNHLVTTSGVRTAPWSTAIVNVIGCLVIGLLAGLVAHERLTLSPHARAFVFVGVLGGFTTFSSFGLDTFTLVSSGERGLALVNVLGQVAIGLGAVFVGFELTRP